MNKNKKKILVPFRFENLKHLLNNKTHSPTEFTYGFYDLSLKNQFILDFVFELRGRNDTLVRKFFFLIEFPFAKITKLGLPLSIFFKHKKKYKNVDLIFCINDPISLSILFCKKFFFLKSKVITLFQSLTERNLKFYKNNIILKYMFRSLLNSSDQILVLSESAKNELQNYIGIDAGKIMVFDFGVDINFWTFKQTKKEDNDYILSVGNDMNRDFQTLINSLASYYKIKIVTKQKIVNENVEIYNNVTDIELRNLYQNARIVVIPSKKVMTESSGLSSTLQSMACGTPVVASFSLPFKEIFDDRTDILFFEPNNCESLKKIVDNYWNNSAELSNISKNAYEILKNKRNTKNMLKQIENIIFKTLV
jgi:glycosyltransferase involved in cell wall biosynthesis